MHKKILSSNDLAINGATPAFAEQLHVGRPNIGDKEKFLEYVNSIFERNWLTNNGPMVQEFETRIANLSKVKHCIAMCNGTVALEIAIRALELEGEVIIPSYTFIATAHALSWQAITPVFADINPCTHTLCPQSVKKMITPKTTGIIGVHLWGNAAEVNELQEIAKNHDLKLMFDAAHAFGSSYHGTPIGNFGNCEVLSFHATKFLNSFEGGAILTSDDTLAEKMRLMRNFGFAGLDNVIHMGTNGKMTEICAAMGLANLDALEQILERNLVNYSEYKKGLENIPHIKLLPFNESEKNNYQYIVVEVDENSPVSRDQIVEALHAENIRARKYFWPGCHNMKPYKELYPHAGLVLPNTKLVAERVIVLPTGLNMDSESIQTICSIFSVLLKEN